MNGCPCSASPKYSFIRQGLVIQAFWKMWMTMQCSTRKRSLHWHNHNLQPLLSRFGICDHPLQALSLLPQTQAILPSHIQNCIMYHCIMYHSSKVFLMGDFKHANGKTGLTQVQTADRLLSEEIQIGNDGPSEHTHKSIRHFGFFLHAPWEIQIMIWSQWFQPDRQRRKRKEKHIKLNNPTVTFCGLTAVWTL